MQYICETMYIYTHTYDRRYIEREREKNMYIYRVRDREREDGQRHGKKYIYNTD